MNVLYFSSEQFARVTATSIVSLLENNRDSDSIKIYYIDDGISVGTKAELVKMVSEYNREIFFIPAPDPSQAFQFPFKTRYQMGHSYMRMCIGSLVPKNINRILVLDSDTLVLGNLSELWNLEMKNDILAGVADCVNIKAFRRQFMLEDSDIYCNAGMFLVNLKEWRKNKIEDAIKETIRKHNGNIFFFEQTLMNYACKGKIIKLEAKYNSYTLFYALTYNNLIRWRRPTNFYSESEVKDAVENPQIIHFTRNFYMTSRPWVNGCDHPLTGVYRKFQMLTPWKEIEPDNRPLINKCKYRLFHLVPQVVLAYVATILYNGIRPLMIWKNE